VELKPREIHFRHARPEMTFEHERILRSPLKFSQPDNRIVLDALVLKLPVRGADPQLGQVLERILEATLETLPDPNDFIQTVRCRISEIISFGEPTLDSVAERMALSGRTLQRRLEGEGTTWQAVLDSLRKELALKYVMDSGVSSSSIAFLLGYGEVTSFNRAFRRWTGMPPGEYRKKNSA
jgi:AraC-like DNA-binding protein